MFLKESARPFVNSFQLEDLLIFDLPHLRRLIEIYSHKIPAEQLAWTFHNASPLLRSRLLSCLKPDLSPVFLEQWRRSVPLYALDRVRHWFLDEVFWELTYWKTPQLYEELTAGEYLHPEIFRQLEPYLAGKVVVDAGAGSGRATFEAAHHGARLVHAVEPSEGLLHLLSCKREASVDREKIFPCRGDFAHLPLPDASVDMALACSAFTADPAQGGEAGLIELKRVVRSGGVVVLIWPRPEDIPWLKVHGFRYIALPGSEEMGVHFASPASARRCIRRFYKGKRSALAYLFQQPHASVIPFSALGFNPPCDYCLLEVR